MLNFSHPGSGSATLVRIRTHGSVPLTNGFGSATLVIFCNSCFCSIMDKRGLVVDFYVASKSMVSYSANMGKNQ
jgi:hypothetical protein